MQTDFDALVMGSGIGGLTCAALLSRRGMRVGVVERHHQIGGYAQDFSRDGFTFDSSIHSVSMGNGGFIDRLLSELGIRKKLDVISNSGAARIVAPGFSFSLPANLAELTAALHRDFPGERNAVDAMLADMQKLFGEYKAGLAGSGGGPAAAGPGTARSYGEYIDSFVSDEKLRFLLGSIWPLGGSSPSFAPFYNAFIFIDHALDGSHYVKGGFSILAREFAGAVTEGGGKILTRWPVRSLRTENGRVIAAVNTRGEELSAPLFVSNLSPYILHGSLLPVPSRNALWLRRLKNLSPSVSAVCVYLGLEGDAATYAGHNLTLWFGSADHDAVYRRVQAGLPGDIDHLIIIRPTDRGRGECITLIHLARQRPGIDWREEKKRVADAMIAKAAQVLGDFTPRIRVRETASPHTFERYTGNTAGALYGFENTSDLYGRSKLPFTTYIPNLFQAGHWTKSGGGVYNVMTSGKIVADMILKG